MKKFLTIMLVLVVSISAIAGITYFIKTDKKEEDENLIVKASYEQLITDLEKDIALSLENVAALEAEIELNGLTISSLTTSVVSYKNQVASLESSVEKYEEDIIVKTSELEAKSGEIAELTAELESSNEENEELTAQLELLNKEKSAIETELAELTNEKETLETLIEEKNAEIAELSNSISEKNTELENLSSLIAEKQTIIEDLNTQVENLLLNIENLESENETLTSQVLDLQSQVSTLNVQIEELNATIFDLNTRIDILEEQLANTEKDPNKNYIDDLMMYVIGSKSYNNKAVLATNEGSNDKSGVYVVDLTDYSYKKIISGYTDKLGAGSTVNSFSKEYGICIIDVTKTNQSHQYFIYDIENDVVVESSVSFDYYSKFTSNGSCFKFSNSSKKLYFYDRINQKYTQIGTTVANINGSYFDIKVDTDDYYEIFDGTNRYSFDVTTYNFTQIS